MASAPTELYAAVETRELARYTDPDQAQWFIDRINIAFGGTRTNARMDGNTIRWFGAYYLNLGDWLYDSMMPLTHDQLLGSKLRPVDTSFPTE